MVLNKHSGLTTPVKVEGYSSMPCISVAPRSLLRLAGRSVWSIVYQIPFGIPSDENDGKHTPFAYSFSRLSGECRTQARLYNLCASRELSALISEEVLVGWREN